MKNLNPRIERLKRMMVLEEKRTALQSQLDSLLHEMSTLKDQLLDTAETPSSVSVPVPRVAKAPRGGRTERGSLKTKIMAALEAAGSAGVKVKDLAAAIGTKPVNVHSWFHSALKRKAPIHKITGGHYKLSGSASSGASETKSPKVSKAPAKASKAPRKTTSPGKPKARGGAKRGQLSAQILEALKAAGSGGITVTDLATKLGAKYKNIYIWFATTGKKQSGVKKVGPAKYKLVS